MAGMANMANMNPMGGPVGGPMPMMNNGALPPQATPLRLNDASRTLLNTYIYEYFVHYGMWEPARALYHADDQIHVSKESLDQRRDEPGAGLGDDPMDTDSKSGMGKRPLDLPAPNVTTRVPDTCFLYEWFCLFWDMFNSQKGKSTIAHVSQYVQHTQAQSRMRQQDQQTMLRQIRPEFTHQQYPQHMMRGMQNGGMNMKPGNQLQRAAMANNQNPQTMQMLQQQKAAGQMQRDPSDMDGNRARQASPGSTDNAPSPSKRPRLDGAQFNPNPNVMMPNGRPAQGMPGQQQLQSFAASNPNAQAKSIASYAANLQQHHGNQMPNKPMATAGGPQPQGSPLVPQGPDGAALGQFYNPGDMAPNNMRAGPGNGQATSGSNHALQDYQMQLMLLEQQNKKRLMMARQEQDISGGMVRPDGQGAPGVPGAPVPNAQSFQGNSPPGGRSGASPNSSDQMKRNQQMNNPANVGSPVPDGGAQSRSSPNSMNFMGGNMDPNGGGQQHFFNTPMNGGMRPPSSHPGPQFAGQMNPQHMLAAQRAQQAAAQSGPGMQWQQQGGQNAPGPQPQVQGTPQQRSMPPPSAPQAAAVAASSRNTTSSPQTSNAAPPTPQQTNKAAPKKKDTKSAKSKNAAQKKSNANLNAAATPAAEPEPAPENQAPATPMTPNPQNFAKNQNVPAQVIANGQPAQPVPPAAAPPVPVPQHADPTQANDFMTNGLDYNQLDFANPLVSDNVLAEFDFDSFLHDSNGGEDGAFDFSGGFMEGGEIGAE
ncbi:hypothetical protein B0T26DRAFT_745090 [Lasiosphaeria miniovina]|uniref:LisH domain-containing protein n=1 Tax=Lasiosphaeria miniovina TaxID=1954250 RepID=A0AA40EAP0_9PEZI|nr:uncharacterized protein B0T26DRAFT_745090 [Lasiosphaeria miniovina]KAK0732995.1 hypothetical protein B0T26DRAFT_745090 [Lasiosphaeria miniovina]